MLHHKPLHNHFCLQGELWSNWINIYSNSHVKLLTEILEVNLFAFAYRMLHEDFSSIYESAS